MQTRNRITGTHNADDIPSYLDTIKAFARLTYSSIYIIDYSDFSFEYVSENPIFLCGHTPEEVKRLGYDFYYKQVPENDLKTLDIINQAGFDFYERLSAEQRHLYHITYDFHLNLERGKTILINHKLTPLLMTSDNKMWKALCVVSMSSHKKAGQVTIYREGYDYRWTLDLSTRVWKPSMKPKLTHQEIDMLHLYAQGFTISEIGRKLFVSPNTVKYYRRRIFEHFGVNSIITALHCAVDNKII